MSSVKGVKKLLTIKNGGIPIDRGSDRPIIEKGPLDRGSDRPILPRSIGPLFKEKGPIGRGSDRPILLESVYKTLLNEKGSIDRGSDRPIFFKGSDRPRVLKTDV